MNRYLSYSKSFAAIVTAALFSVALYPAVAEAAGNEPSAATLKDISRGFAEIGKKAIPAVVFIRVEKTVSAPSAMQGQRPFNNPFEFFGDDFMQRFFGQNGAPRPHPRKYKMEGAGSGFLISDDGYILSNNHVVGDADKITVTLNDGREFDAKRIGTDAKSEVAVIKIEGAGFPHLTLGDSSAMQVGEWVIAVGNPFGLTETLTVGVVSAKGRTNVGIADYEDFIQTDAAINPGNSGGPLLNVDGDVIGINTAIYSQSGGYMGIGFAIPINMAKAIKDQLIEHGKVVRGYLGVMIQDLTPALAQSFGAEDASGALVSEVVPDSPADKAGLRQGDIILSVDGTSTEDAGNLRLRVGALAPDTPIRMTVLRDGKQITVKATTGELPSDNETASAPGVASPVTQLGLEVVDLTSELARRYGFAGQEGVLVSAVDTDGAAAEAGIRPGALIVSVNRTPIKNLDAFTRELSKVDLAEGVLLHVKDPHGSRYVVIRIE